MYGQREEIKKRINDIVEKFRQHGATNPEKAMTPQELGLPPRFEEAMKRRLGRTGIFVQVGGKYYLSEEQLKQIEEQRNSRGAGAGWGGRGQMFTLKITRMITAVLVVVLVLVNILVQSFEIRVITAALVVVWIVILVVQIIYLSRARRRFRSPQPLT